MSKRYPKYRVVKITSEYDGKPDVYYEIERKRSLFSSWLYEGRGKTLVEAIDKVEGYKKYIPPRPPIKTVVGVF